MKQCMAAGKLAPQAYKAVADLDRRVSESGIDGALYLLLKIRASQINGYAFCIDLHTREARERGEPKGRIRALDAWAEAKGVFGERMLANVLMAALAINAWNRIAVADPHGAEARHPVMGEGFASLQLEEVWIRFRVGLSARRRETSDSEGEGRTMDHWADYEAWREHRRELLRETQELQLEREARKVHETFAHSKKRLGAVEVRWGLLGDEAKVAKLLELNGMPRWVAFEERFIVAESDDELLAAARYRTEPKRLLLGLLVTDPWAEERRIAVALYAGARRLALELGANDIVARIDRHRAAYPYEAGYHRWGGGWRMDLLRPVERREGPPAGGWRMRIAQMGAFVLALLPRRQERQ